MQLFYNVILVKHVRLFANIYLFLQNFNGAKVQFMQETLDFGQEILNFGWDINIFISDRPFQIYHYDLIQTNNIIMMNVIHLYEKI